MDLRRGQALRFLNLILGAAEQASAFRDFHELFGYAIGVAKDLNLKSMIIKDAVKLGSSELRYKACAILLSDKVLQIQTKTKSAFAKILNLHKTRAGLARMACQANLIRGRQQEPA